jgi:hypothetical protein
MPCKKCGGNKAESDAICDYCHKAREDPNINQAKILKLGNLGTPYPRPLKKYKQLIIKKVLHKAYGAPSRIELLYSRYLKHAR